MVVELGIVRKSFELTINSKIIWVNLNATKRMIEYIKHNGLSHSSFEAMLFNFQNSKGMYTNSCYQLVENFINRQKG